MKLKKVAILGASNKAERYSYKALKMLLEKGYEVYPVNPILESVDGLLVYHNLSEIKDHIDTITIYMRPERWQQKLPEILEKKPDRVICNPGTESCELEEIIRESGIECVEACTLVLLRTGRF